VAAGRPATDALTIHHRVQGSGSGIDILASIHGGMGRVDRGSWSALSPVVPVVTFTGRSARTGPRVEQYRQWAGAERDAFIHRSRALVEGFAADPIAGFRFAWQLLLKMSVATHIAYTTPEIEYIVQTAEALGGGAKPSGAGGGDCTVALFPTDHGAQEFRRRMTDRGLPCIPVQPAAGAHTVTT
jgi:phosphomevalonate kinase